MSQPLIFEYRDYLRKRYGEVLYRVPVDVGLGCPHRQSDGSGGCTFCPEDGARAVQLGDIQEIGEQVQAGVAFARKRYKAKAFMAYLQAYTSTFGSSQQLEQLVHTICEDHHFHAITFGARPDCLSENVLTYLKNLNKRLDVWVELGVQTIHDQTLKHINRGHDWNQSRDAITRLNKAGLQVGVHLILGLPGETVTHFKETVNTVCALPINALKLHNLHVIQGTELERQFLKHSFPIFSEHEYVDILLELLPLIPAELPIIRLTTDTPQEVLTAPHWSMSKGQFRGYLFQQMKKLQIYQGMARPTPTQAPLKGSKTPPEKVATKDGSITFWNAEVKEYYHTMAGARSEALQKYSHPGKLDQRLAKGKVKILDICFGLGYNSLLACEKALQTGSRLDTIALEMDKRVVQAASQDLIEQGTAFDWKDCLSTLYKTGYWKHESCSITMVWGDARHTINTAHGPFDLIWLDAFSTQRNSELWTIDFFKRLYPLLDTRGALLTYCAAIPVRAAFIEAGFYVGETAAFGRERGGTIVTKNPQLIEIPLPERDLFLIQSTRGTPYRDPDGTRTNKEILRHREEEIVRRKAEASL